MLDILAITAPIYLLIALGYVSCRRGIFKTADLRSLGQFVVQFGLSALLFRATSQRPLDEVLDGHYLLAYTLGSLIPLGVGLVMVRAYNKPLSAGSFAGLGMSLSNSGLIGSAIITQLLGPHALTGLAMCLAVESGLILPLTLTLAELDYQRRHHQATGPVWRIAGVALLKVLRAPFVMAAMCGFVVASLHVPLPVVVLRAVDLLAMSASPVALFVIGGNLLEQAKASAPLGLSVQVAFGKLLLHPLCVLLLVMWFPPADPVLRTAAVAFAAVPMFSIYPILAMEYGEDAFCARALVIAMTLSFATISFWLWLVQHGLGWSAGS